MANIIDYLKWRGDIPFSVDPFNEVDALILCQFEYIKLDNCVSESLSDKITVAEAFSRYDCKLVPEGERIFSFDQDGELFFGNGSLPKIWQYAYIGLQEHCQHRGGYAVFCDNLFP